MLTMFVFLYLLLFLVLMFGNILFHEKIRHWEYRLEDNNYKRQSLNEFDRGQLYEMAKTNKERWKLIQIGFNLILLFI